MLRTRLVSAAIIIAALGGLLYLDFHFATQAPGIWLLPLALAAAALLAGELLELWRDRPDRPRTWAVHVGVLVTVAATAVPTVARLCRLQSPAWPFGELGWPLLGFAVAVAVAFVAELARYAAPGHATNRIGLTVLASAYAGLLLSFLMLLRSFHNHAWGMAALVTLIVIVKISDTGAYFVGKSLGRHPLAPVLSPKKTVEGALGGIVAACLGALLCWAWIVPALVGASAERGSVWGWIVLGLFLALAGMFGDLAESLLKRDAQRKDSSSWLPGLGGVLDILDSLLFAAVAAYICWQLGLVGPQAVVG